MLGLLYFTTCAKNDWFNLNTPVLILYGCLKKLFLNVLFTLWPSHSLSITAAAPWKTKNKRHLLEPVRLRVTKGFVLSESLLEKLDRRFAWFPDCCLRVSPGWLGIRVEVAAGRTWGRGGAKRRMQTNKKAKSFRMRSTRIQIYWFETTGACVCGRKWWKVCI